MLVELNIKNFAIIEDLNIQFTKGLNLLTGETGSGKSIIIEALGIILGGRGTKDLIRTGKDKSTLQAVFLVEDLDKFQDRLLEFSIDLDEDRLLIISKEISRQGPSISRINGRTVTLASLNKITAYLIDIFAQEEHQSLLNISNHKKLIDSFGNQDFLDLKGKIKNDYEEYVHEREELEKMTLDASQRNRELDILKFQIDEIDSAHLTEKEEELESEYNKLANIKDISLGISEINELYSGFDYDSPSIKIFLDKSTSILNDSIKYDSAIKVYLDRLESVNIELEDINNDLKDYLSRTELDEEHLFKLRERIDLVNSLKRKYGKSIEEIILYRNKINEDYLTLVNYEEEIRKRQERIEEIAGRLEINSRELSIMRKEIALSLEGQIGEELDSLNMSNVSFKVDFKENSNYSADGKDLIEFLISTNIGEDLKSLSRIVSGGEMSRIMLAFKAIFAEADNIPSLIFDEIDSGISGRTAQIVGEKIYKIARDRQVISVSHLPQIAALADSHFQINKSLNEEGKVVTQIYQLDEEERVIELARLLGGVNVTETTLKHAREMLEMTKDI